MKHHNVVYTKSEYEVKGLVSLVEHTNEEKEKSKVQYATAAKIAPYLLLLGGALVLIAIVVEVWFWMLFHTLFPPGMFRTYYILEYMALIPLSLLIIVWKFGLGEDEWFRLVLLGALGLGISLLLLAFFFLILLFTILPLIGSVVTFIGGLWCMLVGYLRRL